MKLPPSVLLIRDRYVAAFPLWVMPPGLEAEERARQWSVGLCEQVAFERPGEGYGTKRASPTRPVSKDGLARVFTSGLWVWDLLSGAGTGSPTLVPNPDHQDITGQVFVPVTPTDHLGNSPVPPPPPPPQPPQQPYPDEQTWWPQVFDPAILGDYQRAGQVYPDGPSAFRWAARTAYDIAAGLTKEESLAKHRAEWRAALGLPV